MARAVAQASSSLSLSELSASDGSDVYLAPGTSPLSVESVSLLIARADGIDDVADSCLHVPDWPMVIAR
jgi:hypothetical protein